MTYEEARDFFGTLFCGTHHIPAKIKPWGDGWELNYYEDLATFDFNRLTHAVFLAHDRCVRFSIEPSGPRMIRLIVHKRSCREGRIFERHPTIETALADWRKDYPLEEDNHGSAL